MTGRWGALLALGALAGCGGARDATATDGWVRLAANPGAPAAAYFTLRGGQEPEALTSVSAAGVARAELHESMSKGGMTSMAPLASVPVPAAGTVAFAPGGRHVMLFDVAPAVKPGGAIAMTFVFADGKRTTAPLRVVGPGDPAPF